MWIMTLLTASSAIGLPDFNQPYTYRTRSRTLNSTTGYFDTVEGAPVDASGSIQPVEREELHNIMANVEGGLRIKEAIIIYTTEVLTSGELGSPSFSGAIVTYRGLDWLVVDVEDYSPHGHVEAIAVRIDGQND